MKRSRVNPVSKKRRNRDKDYAERRTQVWERNEGRCERCAAPMTDIHHIAGRGGADPHALTNLAGFCRACHEWVHANPAAARTAGFMRSRHVDRPI